MTDLDQLIAAVEAGKSPVFSAAAFAVFQDEDIFMHWGDALNGSFDAASALHDALLPGWFFNLTNDSALVMRPGAPSIAPIDWEGDLGQYQADGPPARAWALATLKGYRAELAALASPGEVG